MLAPIYSTITIKQPIIAIFYISSDVKPGFSPAHSLQNPNQFRRVHAPLGSGGSLVEPVGAGGAVGRAEVMGGGWPLAG